MNSDVFSQITGTLVGYLSWLQIEVNGVMQPLISVVDPWQLADLKALWPGLRRVAGLPVSINKQPCYQRAYLERARGHSKTQDIATMSVWALVASRRQILGVAAAGDLDQAKLVRDAIQRLVAMNPDLASLLEVQAKRIVNVVTNSELRIMASDTDSSYGLTPDFIIADELTHWPARGDALWHSLFSAAAKRQNCLLLIISNAGTGLGSSWQWKVREAAREDSDWHFSRLDGPVASWIGPKQLAEQERLLPQHVYRRLWLNQWTAEEGDALSMADIDAACTLDEPPHYFPRGTYILGGLDIGVRRDFTGFVTLTAQLGTGRVQLARVQSWQPAKGVPVQFDQVEAAILSAKKELGMNNLFADMFQCEMLGQRLCQSGITIFPVSFAAAGQRNMAMAMLRAFRERRVDMFRDERLIKDLLRLSIVERIGGLRIEAPRSAEDGHSDTAFAFLCALPMALAVAEAPADFGQPHDDFAGYVYTT
jgi:hypothetical protein